LSTGRGPLQFAGTSRDSVAALEIMRARCSQREAVISGSPAALAIAVVNKPVEENQSHWSHWSHCGPPRRLF